MGTGEYDTLKKELDNLKQIPKINDTPSFNDMMTRNKVLMDRIMFVEMMYAPPGDIDQDEKTFKSSQHYITINNILTIAMALNDLQQSFILPTRMLSKLLDMKYVIEEKQEAIRLLDQMHE